MPNQRRSTKQTVQNSGFGSHLGDSEFDRASQSQMNLDSKAPNQRSYEEDRSDDDFENEQSDHELAEAVLG